MSAIATVYAVFADRAEAERIARQMVEEGLAACANILADAQSVYRWKGAIETATETPALFKTRADTADRLASRIVALHSYENPAVVVWPIAFAPLSYGHWVTEQTG